MNEIELLKKKIIYRSKSLGYRESSLVLQNFLEKYIDMLSFNELKLMMDLVNMDDNELINLLLIDSFNRPSSYAKVEERIWYFIKTV
jgi:succinate dehydrogenase flavin-adding protein (antitoxin of CptAB toxin-antitoxin module)